MVQMLIPSAGCWQTGLYSKLSAACWSCCLYASRLDHWQQNGPFCRHTVIGPKPIECNMYLPVDSGMVHSLDKWSKCSFRLLDDGRLGCTVSFQRHAGVAACMPADWTIGQQMVHSAGIRLLAQNRSNVTCIFQSIAEWYIHLINGPIGS